MRFRWIVPFAILLPLHLYATTDPVAAKITTVVIVPGQVTQLHLHPDFESVIKMPEEVTSVVLGSPGQFKAEHSEGEPNYVYVKPITKETAESNLLIATRSGLHIEVELISDRTNGNDEKSPVDFLVEYHASKTFLVTSEANSSRVENSRQPTLPIDSSSPLRSTSEPSSALDEEFQQQARVNSPNWAKWPGKQIETSLGTTRQWSNEIAVSYSILNSSNLPVEIVPPQIQISGRQEKKKKKKGENITSDQLEIRAYRLSATRLEPGERADGIVFYDRPNFKQSTEKLFLQIAQADQIDQPILVRLPFTPAINANNR